MRIALVEVKNFRGIKELRWAPSPGINCLIGPGDSTKTTILDAIELCLNPRSQGFADDCDFFNLAVQCPVSITVTLVDLPQDFTALNRYGPHTRGWNSATAKLEDEPAAGLDTALSINVQIDASLEPHWSIFNDRIAIDDRDPPTVRYKDAQLFATTRLGPYAERHLGWGRTSVLTRIADAEANFRLQLAEASRAAREAFRSAERSAFAETVNRAQALSKEFAVPVRKAYAAELDVQGVSISSGGIALHDDGLPLRTLGTGSSRLIVAALQSGAQPCRVALVDEIEHGLEPHRLARLIRHLKSSRAGCPSSQIFITTHSPITIRELDAGEIFTVRCEAGQTIVRSASSATSDAGKVQGHLRRSPEAFLARKVLVAEGRTEMGLALGLDTHWIAKDMASFALQGAAAINGGGKDNAPAMADYLLDLGYRVFLLMDSDRNPDDPQVLTRVTDKGGVVARWPDKCSTEQRIFLDVPWIAVQGLVRFARDCEGDDSVRATINNALSARNASEIVELSLPTSDDTEVFRRAIGDAAKNDNRPWFKTISRGEQVAAIICPHLRAVAKKPLVRTLTQLRAWIDG